MPGTLRGNEMTIPRQIYQTVASPDRLTPELRSNVEWLRSANSGWEYRLFFDRDCRKFILDHYGRDVVRLYEKINPEYASCRADFFRYLLIYHSGGAYLDIKSTCKVPLNEVLQDNDEFLLSHWRNDLEQYARWGKHAAFGVAREYQNWHIIGAAKHPFLKATIDLVIDNIKNYNPFFDGVGRIGALRTTGPIAYSHAIAAKIGEAPYRVVDAYASGLEYSIFDNPKDHFKLSQTHYSELATPVVRGSRIAECLWKVNQRYGIVKPKKLLRKRARRPVLP